MIDHLPLLLLSLVVVTLYGALFHLLWGRSLKQLGLYWLAALLGFGVGQGLARILALSALPQIGPLHIVEASVVSWLGVFIAKQMRL